MRSASGASNPVSVLRRTGCCRTRPHSSTAAGRRRWCGRSPPPRQRIGEKNVGAAPVAPSHALLAPSSRARDGDQVGERAQRSKNIEMTVTIVKPSSTGALDIKRATGDGGLLAQLPIVIKQLTPGRIKKGAPIVNSDTVWIASPRPPTEEEISSAKKLIGTSEATLNILPSNLYVTYREVDEPNLMLSILANIVSDNSNQISSSAEEAFRQLLEKATKQSGTSTQLDH
jgi:hypothetical protein